MGSVTVDPSMTSRRRRERAARAGLGDQLLLAGMNVGIQPDRIRLGIEEPAGARRQLGELARGAGAGDLQAVRFPDPSADPEIADIMDIAR